MWSSKSIFVGKIKNLYKNSKIQPVILNREKKIQYKCKKKFNLTNRIKYKTI